MSEVTMNPDLQADSRRSWRVRALVTVLAVALAGTALFHLGRVGYGMATSALSTDEFGTVLTFSGKGPGRVITDYRAPKNHIFFNLVNSVFPGKQSLAAWRARLPSLIATVLVAVLILWAFFRWGRLFEGAVLLSLWSFSPGMLDSSMEARGYGFLALAGILASIGAIEYLRLSSRHWLVLAVIAVVLGTYTVPNFLFFGAPLLLGLWIFSGKREALFGGLAAGVGILILYSPVLFQMIAAFQSFQNDPEMDFARVQGVFRTFGLYLLPFHDWVQFLVFTAFLIFPFVIARDRGTSGPALAMLASISCFLILLLLKSPPVRVAAFNTLPFAMAGLLACGGFLRSRLPGSWILLPALLVAGLLAVPVFRGLTSYRFLPSEDWKTAGQLVDRAFPASQRLDFETHAKYLKHYLQDARGRNSKFDLQAWDRGELVVADAGNKWAEGDRFVPPSGQGGFVEMRVPGGVRDVVFYFRPPLDARPKNLAPVLTDGVMQSGRPAGDAPGSALSLQTGPVVGLHSVVLIADRELDAGQVFVTADDIISGTQLAPDEILIAGNTVVISMGTSAQVESDWNISIQVNSPPGVRIVEVFWIKE